MHGAGDKFPAGAGPAPQDDADLPAPHLRGIAAMDGTERADTRPHFKKAVRLRPRAAPGGHVVKLAGESSGDAEADQGLVGAASFRRALCVMPAMRPSAPMAGAAIGPTSRNLGEGCGISSPQESGSG